MILKREGPFLTFVTGNQLPEISLFQIFAPLPTIPHTMASSASTIKGDLDVPAPQAMRSVSQALCAWYWRRGGVGLSRYAIGLAVAFGTLSTTVKILVYLRRSEKVDNLNHLYHYKARGMSQ